MGEPVGVSVRSAEGTRVQQRVADRLGESEPCRLVSEFRAGSTVRQLAERFAMSGSTVKGSYASGGCDGTSRPRSSVTSVCGAPGAHLSELL